MNTKQLSEQDSAQLSALLDGTLPDAQAAALRQRMQSDEALQDAFTEIALTRDAMRALPVAQPPRSLRIDVQRLQQARGWRWWLVMPPAGQLIPSMTVALSLCLCILFGQQALTPSPEPAVLKGAVMAESAASNTNTASLAAPDTSAAAADTMTAPVDMSVLAAPAPDMTPWLWAGAGTSAGAAIASLAWARRVAQRRRVTPKR